MPTADHVLNNLSFPAQYLDVGEALTRAMGQDVAAYFRYCGIADRDLLKLGQAINGKQIQRSNEWMLAICPPDVPPLATFLAHFPVTSHGPLGMLAITARTLGEALMGVLDYSALFMPAYVVRRHDLRDQVHMIFEACFDFGSINDFFTETVVAAFLQIAPFLTRLPQQLPEIHFTHAPLGDASAYERALPVRFFFSSAQNKVVLMRADLEIALLAPSLTSHLQMRSALEQQRRQSLVCSPVTQEVKRLLQQALREGRVLNAESIAGVMALSTRSLSRRLQEESSTLPQLRAEIGCEYAQLLLLETDGSIAQIARATGFRDAASFARAFRRCTGRPPSALRSGVAGPVSGGGA